MKPDSIKRFQSHGDGRFTISDFKAAGENIVFENGVLVFHPENIILESNIYIGHYTILKAYYKNRICIGSNTWIGQGAFLHGGGGIEIGASVGIGPYVKILTSVHQEKCADLPLIDQPLQFEEVVLKEGCDIGVGSIILPGVTVGRGAIIGAGSVVASDIPDYCIAVGSPAKVTRKRLQDGGR